MAHPVEQVIQVGQLQMRFFVDGTHTEGHVSVAEMAVPAGAKMPPPHAHSELDEVVVAGTLHHTVDSTTHEVTPGVRIFSSRGKPHGFENRRDSEACVLLTYFRDIAALLGAGGPPDFTQVKAALESYGLMLAKP